VKPYVPAEGSFLGQRVAALPSVECFLLLSLQPQESGLRPPIIGIRLDLAQRFDPLPPQIGCGKIRL